MVFVFLTGCLSPYQLEVPGVETFLVISGRITQSAGPHYVDISYANDYGSFLKIPVSGAEVTIFDNLGNTERLYEVETGRYYLIGNAVKGSPGISYYIEVNMGNGATYRSLPETMPEVVEPLHLFSEPVIIEEINDYGNLVTKILLRVYVNTPVKTDGKPVFLRWNTEIQFSFTELKCDFFRQPKTCYVTRKINENDIVIYSSEGIGADVLENYPVAYRGTFPRYELAQRHFFNVAQLSLTKTAYNYWKKLEAIAEPTGTIFDIPPAPVRGNIYNIDDKSEMVLGYFEAVAVDTIRTFTTPGDLPFDTYNTFCFDDGLNPLCCDCLGFENSIDIIPPYWFE